MLEFSIFFASLVLTIVGVALFKRHKISRKLWDIPNERSSHATPKQRGGGIVIVAVSLGLYLAASYATNSDIRWSYVTAALMVAAVSWLDDLTSLAAWIRFFVHTAAAVLLVAWCGWVGDIYLPIIGEIRMPAILGALLTILWIVWMTNAYNFMDGIDGIAGSQAIVSGLAWAVLGALRAERIEYLFGGIIVFSALGFLLHNWDPATVFMGDVGSAFLGFTLAAMPLLAAGEGRAGWPFLFPAAVIFLWLFVFDTVYTFGKRLFRGERVWEAHREHIYQHLAASGYSHGTVCLLYASLGAFTSASMFAALQLGAEFQFMIPLAAAGSALTIVLLSRGKKI